VLNNEFLLSTAIDCQRSAHCVGFAPAPRHSSFRQQAKLPSEGGALPSFLPGVGWSDQWAFWQCGYPAFMGTDTAPFRYPHYHEAIDTPDKLDYDRFALVVSGMEKVIAELTR
jgi:hypothetical protein